MQIIKEIVVIQNFTKNNELNQVIMQSLAYFPLFAFFPLTLCLIPQLMSKHWKNRLNSDHWFSSLAGN